MLLRLYIPEYYVVVEFVHREIKKTKKQQLQSVQYVTVIFCNVFNKSIVHC